MGAFTEQFQLCGPGQVRGQGRADAVRCGDADVLVVARNRDGNGGYDAARVLAAYAAAQGPRLGCGAQPVRVSS